MVREARDDWWLIGSAAMTLHGARPIEVADIDLLMSRRDAAAVAERLRLTPSPADENGLFRSDFFTRVPAVPLAIELMAGFHVRVGSAWREVRPASRQAIQVGSALLYVPSVRELIEMGRLFGRPKDREREALLLPLL